MPGKLTLLTALWKSGKTTLLAHLLAQRRLGGEFLGLKVAAGHSVVVSEEPQDLWPMRHSQHRFGPELSIVPRPFAGRPTFVEFEQLGAQLIDIREQTGLDLVVFDSLAVFLPSRNENNAGSDRRWPGDRSSPWRKPGFPCCSCTIHRKGNRRSGRRPAVRGRCRPRSDIVLEMRIPAGIRSHVAAKSSAGPGTTETFQADGDRAERRRPHLRAPARHERRLSRQLGNGLASAIGHSGATHADRNPQRLAAGHRPAARDDPLRWLDKAVQLGLAVRHRHRPEPSRSATG